MIGDPRFDIRYGRPSNLFSPLEAKRRHTCSWSAASMLTQNRPTERILGQLLEVRSGKNATSGGFSETDVNEPTAIPASNSSAAAVTTHTPVGYCPSTSRNQRGSPGLCACSSADCVMSNYNKVPSGAFTENFGATLLMKSCSS